MQFLYSFWRRITDDLSKKELIPLKILFFVHISTLFVLYPYLSIHMRELGINVEETAIMSAIIPVVSIVMPPLAGMLADKIGNFRLLLAISSGVGGLSALLLLIVPMARVTVTFPPEVELLASCGEAGLQLQPRHDHFCQPIQSKPYQVDIKIPTCGFVCKSPYDLSETDIIDSSNSYEVQLNWQNESHTLHYRYAVSSYLPSSAPFTLDHATQMKNHPYINSTISKIDDDLLFFSVPNLYQLQCDYENKTCYMGDKDNIETSIDQETKYKVWVSYDARKGETDVSEFFVGISVNGQLKRDDQVSCTDNNLKVYGAEGISVKVASKELSECSSACIAKTPRNVLCENMKQEIEIDPVFTFWIYLSVRLFMGIISSTAFAMFEGATISILRKQNADYGLQRLYGNIGGMISSPLSGLLIDYASQGKGYKDYRPAFYLYAVLKVLSGFLMLGVDLQFKQPAKHLLSDVKSVFMNIEMLALLIVCFVMGTAWGFLESFLFWLLQDMGASGWLLGITITVGGVAGLPLLVMSGPIIKKLGHANVLFIGFVFYAIRLLGYSLTYTPALCLIYEALESVTSSLSFTAAVTYAAKLSSTTTDSSVQGLLGGIYYGVGKGSGSLIGGYLKKFFGDRPTYQMFAGATFITGCIYFLFNTFYLRKRIGRKYSGTCEKMPELDVESRDTGKDIIESHKDVSNFTLDVSKMNADKTSNVDASQIQKIKTATDSIDGGSDSGVDNPAYNDTESSNDIRRVDNKIDG